MSIEKDGGASLSEELFRAASPQDAILPKAASTPVLGMMTTTKQHSWLTERSPLRVSPLHLGRIDLPKPFDDKRRNRSTSGCQIQDRSCNRRRPMLGEMVHRRPASGSFERGDKRDEWILDEGELATVVEVNADGDFRLRNRSGMVSCWLSRSGFEYIEVGLGFYFVTQDGLLVNEEISRGSYQVAALAKDTQVQVMEISDVVDEGRIRARIRSPAGWISLRKGNANFVAKDWDSKHHLKEKDNEAMPKHMRDYFSQPASFNDLKSSLQSTATSTPSRKSVRSLLRTLEQPEHPAFTRSFITPDCGPPLVPSRHKAPGGDMIDRDGLQRTWNNRWHTGVSLMNEGCHPDHREYFTQDSVFAASPSQRWRRFLDQEVGPGEWASISTRRQPRFPPLGGRLRGRSGSPIPDY